MCGCTCIGAGLSAAPPSAQVRPDDDNHNNLVTIAREPQVGETPQRALDAWLTPNPLFYVRNHFDTPRIRCESWALRIDGLVSNTVELSLDALKRLPRVTMPITMECAGNNRSDLYPPTPGNQFQSGAVSAAYWAGARLSDALALAGAREGAIEALFEGCDSGEPEPGSPQMPYLRSLPLDVALHPHTMLAYEMNGSPLPSEHGHPLRLIVPGWYGMASVKWLRRITLIDTPYEGYFQGHKYVIEDADGNAEPLTKIGVKSLIGSPAEGAEIAIEKLGEDDVCVTGMAWSGNGRIARVDFSDDCGETWRRAEIVGPSERYAWQKWHCAWRPTRRGDYTLMARAVDASGSVQPMRNRWNKLGYMVNGVKPVRVTVAN